MDADASKGLALAALILATFLPGAIPVFLYAKGYITVQGSPRQRKVLALLNCFAGGVFLGTCLMHLMAEGREELEEYKEKAGWDLDFPLFEALCAAGLFLVAYVEKIGFAVASRKPESQPNQTTENGGSHHNFTNVGYTPEQKDNGVYGVYKPAANGSSGPMNGGLDGHACGMTTESGLKQREASAGAVMSSPGEADHHHHCLTEAVTCEPVDVNKVAVLHAMVLLAALSFHTVFDGLAIGLQKTNTDVWAVFVAIALHKALVAFCLGLELAAATPKKRTRPLVILFVFSLIAPIGVGIGMALTSGNIDENAQLLSSSILQGLATGTFLYVTFFEILGQQFAHHHQGDHAHGEDPPSFGLDLLKVTVTVIGFAGMASIKLLEHED